MQLKKILKLAMLSGIVVLGSTYIFSSHTKADIKNEFPRIKNDYNSRDIGGLINPKKSKIRLNRYKLINRSKIKTKLFFQNSGNFYSKNLGIKYQIKNGSSYEGYGYYADAKEKLYNKKTKKYNTYYHLNSFNNKISGWTWDKNLISYQSSKTKLNKLIRSIFPGAKVDSDLQYLVNLGETNNYKNENPNYDSAFLDVLLDITKTNPGETAKTGKHEPYLLQISKNDTKKDKYVKKYFNKLNDGKISYKNYVKSLWNHYWKHFKLNKKSYEDYRIGVLSYPKSDSRYGSFSLILEKK